MMSAHLVATLYFYLYTANKIITNFNKPSIYHILLTIFRLTQNKNELKTLKETFERNTIRQFMSKKLKTEPLSRMF